MFRSKELNGPSKMQTEDSAIRKTSVGSPNGILPKSTSTPLNPRTPESRRSKVLPPLLSRQGTPRRYSLSDTNSPTPKPHSNPYATNSPGPLLASMSFADNVSMYEETKSSGLARRIVSYREAQEEQRPTHQEKYHSPGLFPVVHLFKNSSSPLPTKKVKVKLASPEYLRSYSPQHRSKILEEISKPRLHRQLSLPSHPHNNDTGTKSVLDALKEISRKRIHSNEEIDPLEDLGKRPKTDLFNGNATGSGKRLRVDSPVSDQADSQQRQKKFCVYDEFAASKSSSDFSYLAKSELSKSKRKALNTSTESLLLKPKQVKVSNAETQTPAPVPETKSKEVTKQPEETTKELKNKNNYPLKVFDDAPLQQIRKSRLAALMGTMLGKDIVIPLEEQTNDSANDVIGKSSENKSTDEPKVPEVKKSTTDNTDGALKSILTAVKSSEDVAKPKNVEEKHVHFDVPATSTVVSEPSATQKSTSFSSLSDKTTTPVTVSAMKTTTETSKPAFSFGSASKTDTAVSSATFTTPLFNFPKPTTESKPDSAVTASPPKVGGFKFDLKAPAVNKTTTSSITFPVVSSTVTTTASSATFSFGTPVTSTPASISSEPSASQSKPTFTFGAPPKSDTPDSTNEVKPAETTSTVEAPVTTATLTFGSIPQINTGFKFGTVSSQPQQSASLAVATVSTPTINVTATTTSSAPSIFGGFGGASEQTSASKPQPPTFAFGGASSAFTANSATFGATTTSTPTSTTFSTSLGGGFGSSTNPGNNSPGLGLFGGFSATPPKPTATTPAFGSTTTPAPSFGANTTTPSSFGSNTTSLPTFLSNTATTTSSMFSTAPATTTSATFGTATSTATFKFPAPVTSAFGQNLTSSSTTPVFASPSAVKPNAFGSSTFGGSSATAFGSAAATTNQPSSTTFGGNSAPAFGSSTAPSNQNASLSAFGGNNPTFGSSTAPNNQNASATNFGANSTPTFGSSTNQPSSVFGGGSNAFGTTTTNQNTSSFGGGAFAAPAPTTTTAPSMFGDGNKATSTFTFGANKQQPPNPFGGSGATSTATTGSSFGSSSSFSSSASSTAGSFSFGGSAPAFGSNAQKSAFGAASAPSFGQTQNKPTFSFSGGSTEPKAVPSFGSGTAAPTFGAPATNNNQGFGSSATSAFGATNSTSGFGTQPQSNGGFNFGANSAATNTFAFGSNAANKEVPKPTFNFTGNANPPSFGSTPTPSFGASSSFTGQPQFMGASAPAGGVFTIGSGSTPGSRPRAQIRAKRRT